MTPARADPALRSRVRDAASGAVDNAEFRNVVLGAIRDRVWFDGACLCPVDPALPVPTAVTAIGFDDRSQGGPASARTRLRIHTQCEQFRIVAAATTRDQDDR